MNKTLLALILALYASTIFACNAMLTNQHVEGLNRVCVYSHLFDTVTTVVKSSSVCPAYLYVDH